MLPSPLSLNSLLETGMGDHVRICLKFKRIQNEFSLCSAQTGRLQCSTSLRAPFACVSMASHNSHWHCKTLVPVRTYQQSTGYSPYVLVHIVGPMAATTHCLKKVFFSVL